MPDVEKIIRENIADIFHMSFSTSDNNKPWTVELHFAYDEQLNIYFVSLPSTRHCLEINKNSYVSGTIVRQYDLSAIEPVGVYYEGQARKLETDSDKKIAFDLLHSRNGLPNSIYEESSDPNGHQFYKVSVDNWYAYGKFGSDHGQKLKWIR
jgi:uncharacterized protein YhbP (UPF0306 family)